MNWSKSNSGGRAVPSYLDYDAGPPLPPRNQLATSRAIRLSDSADLLYEVPHEFSNHSTSNTTSGHNPTIGVLSNSSTAYSDHPVYATVQRKPHRYFQSEDRPDLTTATGWTTYAGGGYATMTWKRVPPPKPPRKSAQPAPLNRSLSQQQYHSKSQHQLHLSSNRAFGYEFVPISGSGGESGASSAGSDIMKRSASNDGEPPKMPQSSESGIVSGGSSRFSTFLGNSSKAQLAPYYHENDDQSLMSDSAFSSLYDEILPKSTSPMPNLKNSNSSTLPHPPRTSAPPSSSTSGRSAPDGAASAPSQSSGCSGKSTASSLNRKAGGGVQESRAPSLHQRSKSEHHPLCPNFHPSLPPRPPLPPKPPSTMTMSSSGQNNTATRKRDNGEPPVPARKAQYASNGTTSTESYFQPEEKPLWQPDLYPERPPSPETAVDGIRSVIKPLSKEYVAQANSLRRDMQTFVEEDLFSAFDSTGKMVQVRLRKAANLSKLDHKLIATDILLDDALDVVRLRDNSNSASTLPRSSASNRLSKASMEDCKKSLRRTKHHATDHTGTAERRKKKSSLSKASRSVQNLADSKGDLTELKPALVIKPIDIDHDPVPAVASASNGPGETCFDHSQSDVSRSESTSNGTATTAPTMTATKSEDNNRASEDTAATATATGLPEVGPSSSTSMSTSEQQLSTKRTRSPLIPFDANKEWGEIEKILESFGSDLCSETLFLDELEKQFTAELNKDKAAANPSKEEVPAHDSRPELKQIQTRPSTDKTGSVKPTVPPKKKAFEKSVGDWLAEMNLGMLSEHFVENGFDHLLFMGPNGLEASDLEELGIEDREAISKILDSAKNFPSVKQVDRDNAAISVDEWLSSLKLQEYSENFKETGFPDMERVRKIWEVELNALLGIKKLGHRKRILCSLGKRNSVVSASQLSLLQ